MGLLAYCCLGAYLERINATCIDNASMQSG